jgi:hypothetical protein
LRQAGECKPSNNNRNSAIDVDALKNIAVFFLFIDIISILAALKLKIKRPVYEKKANLYYYPDFCSFNI